LAAQPAPIGGDPKWNFTKFLVDRSGNVVARFDSSVTPEDKGLRGKIDELLAATP
jgi:glutathione peroxidase